MFDFGLVIYFFFSKRRNNFLPITIHYIKVDFSIIYSSPCNTDPCVLAL